jgi:transposase
MKEPPQGLEPDRQVGSRLEALIVSYRQEQHRSYERTQEALHDLHGVHLSQGGIDQVMQRAGRAANEQMPRLQEQVASSAVINSDETSVRVKGQTWWHWVFGTAIAVVHRIQPSRAASVIEGVMGKHQAQVWGSDCLAAQLKAPAQQRHICLAHQIRDLPRLIDGAGCSWWAKSMQTVFRAALHLHHQRDTLPSDQFAVQVARLDRIVDWLLARSPPGGAALRLCRRYRKHRASLFVFLSRTDVDPTHNVSERAVRPSVIHTKVTGGFRSEWGAHAYASLCSVIDTAELQGTTAFAALQKLMGTPALPLPQL